MTAILVGVEVLVALQGSRNRQFLCACAVIADGHSPLMAGVGVAKAADIIHQSFDKYANEVSASMLCQTGCWSGSAFALAEPAFADEIKPSIALRGAVPDAVHT